jgi:hypothetical protein
VILLVCLKYFVAFSCHKSTNVIENTYIWYQDVIFVVHHISCLEGKWCSILTLIPSQGYSLVSQPSLVQLGIKQRVHIFCVITNKHHKMLKQSENKWKFVFPKTWHRVLLWRVANISDKLAAIIFRVEIFYLWRLRNKYLRNVDIFLRGYAVSHRVNSAEISNFIYKYINCKILGRSRCCSGMLI